MFFTSIAARTDLGLVRAGNEDSALHHPRVIAVADGMGGAAGGEVASKIAIETLASRITALESDDLDDESRLDILQGTLAEIEGRLVARIESDPNLNGMGTTLTVLMPIHDLVAMLHIGDSRAYRLRNGAIARLSHDHTVIQELIDQGKLTPEQAHDHPQRSMLTQALMGKGAKDFQLEEFPIQLFPAAPGDIYLVASDGLSSVLDDALIAKVLADGSIDQAANNLVAMVRDGGAPDNVTIVLATVGERSDLPAEISLLGAAYE